MSVPTSWLSAPPRRADGRFAKLVAILCALVLAALAALALAAPAPALAEDVVVAHDSDNVKYTDIDKAWNAARSGKVVYMDADWHRDRALGVPEGESVTLKMCGHKVYRDYNESGDGCIFWLYSNSSLTLDGSDFSTDFAVVGLKGLDARDTFTVTSGGLVTGGHSNNSGGAIEMKEGSYLKLVNVAVAGNKAYTANGGAVRTDGKNCTIEMENAQICYNASSKYGGGVYINNADSKLAMRSSSISYNWSCGGAGVYSDSSNTSITMRKSHIDHNTDCGSNDGGGGVYFNSSDFTLAGWGGSTVSFNTTDNKPGGAVATANSDGGTIYGITFEGNKAPNDKAGALYLDSSNVSVENCTFISNESGGNGGAIYSAGNGFELRSSSLTGNSSKANGGAVYFDHSGWYVGGCTVRGNSCSERGGGFYVNANNRRMTDTTITGNTAGLEGGGIFVYYKYDVEMGFIMRVYGNTRGPLEGGNADDVFLDDSGGVAPVYKAYIKWVTWTGASNSRVGFRTGITGTRELVHEVLDYLPCYFFLDQGGSYHLSMDDCTLSQVPGATTYKLSVNGAQVGEYAYGAQVTVDANELAADTEAFVRWDASASTGLWNADDVLKEYKKPVQTFSEPGTDVNLAAVYMTRLTSGSIKLGALVPGAELPSTATLTRPDGKTLHVSVAWAKVTEQGNEAVTGTVEYGTTYVATVQASQDTWEGWAYSLSPDASAFTLQVGSDAKTNQTASASTDRETGVLTVVSKPMTTRLKALTSLDSLEAVQIQAGQTAEALAAAMPQSVTGTVEGGSKVELALNVADIDWSTCVDKAGNAVFDEQGNVAEPSDDEDARTCTVSVAVVAPDLDVPESLASVTVRVVVSHADLTVTFEYGDGSGTTTSTTVEWGKTVAAPTEPTWENHVFQGWYAQGATSAYVFLTPVKSDLTLTARWDLKEFTVTFVAKGATPETQAVKVKWGESVGAPATAPVRDSATLAGWHVEGTGEAYDLKAPVTSDLTLVADWSHTVTFKYGNGQDDASVVVADGQAVEQPAEPTWENHVFQGWFAEGSDSAYVFSTPVTSNLTLTGAWDLKEFTVTFVAKGATPETQAVTVKWGQPVGGPATAPVRDSATLAGWHVEGTGEAYDLTAPVTSDLTLVADWSHAVTFKYGNGQDDASVVVADGQTVEQPTEPTWEGHVFQGWFADGSDSAYVFSTPVTSNLTLTARWALEEYTVTFVAKGATPETQAVKVKWGEPAKGPATAPSKESANLAGWHVEGTGAAYDLNAPVTSSLTLVADWSHTVTFEPANGQGAFTVEVADGKACATPDKPAREGYVFRGWYLGADEYVFSAPVTSNLTLTGLWDVAAPTSFIDVPAGQGLWYYDRVTQAAQLGLMTGYKNGIGVYTGYFGPEDNITRGQVATVLWRAAGCPEGGKTPFSKKDVPDGEFYSKAVAWCYNAGIITGYQAGPKKGTFCPEDNVTREELATMIARFEAYKGIDVSGAPTAAFDACTDAASVSNWAHDSVVWCAAADVMSGKDVAAGVKRFDPQENATRAQAAKMFVRAWLIASGQEPAYQAEAAAQSEPAAQSELGDLAEATFDDVASFEAVDEPAAEPAEATEQAAEATDEAADETTDEQDAPAEGEQAEPAEAEPSLEDVEFDEAA